MIGRRDFFFRALFASFHSHASLLTFFVCFFILFHSCCFHARVFGKTLLHEFPIYYSHTEWYLLFSRGIVLSLPKLRLSTSNHTKTTILPPRDQSRGVTPRLEFMLFSSVLPFAYASSFRLLLSQLCSNRCAEALVVKQKLSVGG